MGISLKTTSLNFCSDATVPKSCPAAGTDDWCPDIDTLARDQPHWGRGCDSDLSCTMINIVTFDNHRHVFIFHY